MKKNDTAISPDVQESFNGPLDIAVSPLCSLSVFKDPYIFKKTLDRQTQ